MKKVCMIGTGYVGLVTGTCFAELGHKVVCVDKVKSKIDTLNQGRIPIYEPGLKELVSRNKKKGRIRFTNSMKDGVTSSDIIFIAVNTPPQPDGNADLSFVEACTREAASYVTKYKLLVEKSTVPVQTGERIQQTLKAINVGPDQFEVASNPEFLREGSAIQDFLKPDRIVIGVGSKRAEKELRGLYSKIKAPMVVTDIKSAELIKHASNSFLAMKISYINTISRICERVGADVEQVAEGMGFDKRIGKSFLKAGIGYGGSCFPKDLAAFIKIADKIGVDFGLLKQTHEVNEVQRYSIVKKCEEKLWTFRGKTIAVWGLAFKPNTDDLRNAPSIDILKAILDQGASVRACDPVAAEKMKEIYPTIQYVDDPIETAKGADALLCLTEWDKFSKVNLKKLKSAMASPLVIDGRNIFNPETMARLGFQYSSVGRPSFELN